MESKLDERADRHRSMEASVRREQADLVRHLAELDAEHSEALRKHREDAKKQQTQELKKQLEDLDVQHQQQHQDCDERHMVGLKQHNLLAERQLKAAVATAEEAAQRNAEMGLDEGLIMESQDTKQIILRLEEQRGGSDKIFATVREELKEERAARQNAEKRYEDVCRQYSEVRALKDKKTNTRKGYQRVADGVG